MKNRSSAFQRYRKHAILIALASILVLAFILTLSTFGVQAATVDFSSQTSSSQLAPNVISIDGYVFGVVNGGDYPLSGWDVHAQFQDGTGAVYDATTDGNGYYKFDDLGCAVLWLKEEKIPWAAQAIIWITDAKTGAWIDARKAKYVSGTITPMAYGFAAYTEETLPKGAKVFDYPYVAKRIEEIEKENSTKVKAY
jgi:hypothetical protein